MATLTDIIGQIEQLIDKRDREQAERLYPVGIVIESYTLFDPAVQFGIGTWERLIDGRVLVAASDGYAGQEGGSDTVSYTPAGTVGGTAITVDQMPSHTHSQKSCDSQGGHTHYALSAHENTGFLAYNNNLSETSNAQRVRVSTTITGNAWRYVIGGAVGATTADGSCLTFAAYTQSAGSHSHTTTLNDNGGGKTHAHGFTGTAATINVCQKWRGVYRWRRIS